MNWSTPFNPNGIVTEFLMNAPFSARDCSMANREDEQDCARSDFGRNTPKNLVSKRPRGSPTTYTPHREEKRVSLREINRCEPTIQPRRLYVDGANSVGKEKWCDEELKALVEFILFHSSGEKWPCHKQTEFWNSAGEFVRERSRSSQCRTGMLLCISCICTYKILFQLVHVVSR